MNPPSRPETPEARIAALEARVADLQQRFDALDARVGGTPRAAPSPPPVPSPPSRVRLPRRAPRDAAARMRAALRSEDWLGKLGIALVLVGVLFFFKYGIDRGWLGPVVRVGAGAALGAFLLAAGLKLAARRRLGQVLLGGAIATFYTTIFAAFQFYALLSYPLAVVAMSSVTLLAFALAIGQDDGVLGVVAVLGGLATPFVLYTDEGSVPGLVVYTSLVVASAAAIYLRNGWRTLLWASAAGGWLVMLVAWVQVVFQDADTWSDEAALLAGAGICWLAFGGVPTVRTLLHHAAPDRWPVPPTRFTGVFFLERPALLLAAVAPLATLFLAYEVMEEGLPDVVIGLLILAAAGGYAAACAALRRRGLPALGSAHAVAAALLAAFSIPEFVDNVSVQLLLLAAEALAVHAAAQRLPDRALRATGHALTGVVVVAFIARLGAGGELPVLLNGRALADLTVLALLAGSAFTLRQGGVPRRAYLLAVYLGLLGWFWRDLEALDNGQAFVSLAWGVTALLLLAAGWYRDADGLRTVGLVTLGFVVAKLFVIDLAKLDAVWRILLFLGLGGLILLLSYLFPRLWRPSQTPTPVPAAEEG